MARKFLRFYDYIMEFLPGKVREKVPFLVALLKNRYNNGVEVWHPCALRHDFL